MGCICELYWVINHRLHHAASKKGPVCEKHWETVEHVVVAEGLPVSNHQRFQVKHIVAKLPRTGVLRKGTGQSVCPWIVHTCMFTLGPIPYYSTPPAPPCAPDMIFSTGPKGSASSSMDRTWPPAACGEGGGVRGIEARNMGRRWAYTGK